MRLCPKCYNKVNTFIIEFDYENSALIPKFVCSSCKHTFAPEGYEPEEVEDLNGLVRGILESKQKATREG